MIRRIARAFRALVSGSIGAPAASPQTMGFTLVEVLLVSAAVSIVARIAAPNVNHLLTRARAADIMGDIGVVRTAAYSYLAEHHIFPPDAPAGQVPEGLEEFLNEGFDFQGEGYTLDWELWSLSDGLPSRPGVNQVAAVTVVPEDPGLGDALRAVVGSSGWFVIQGHYTFIVAAE